jgi:hypothetical protein
MLSVNIFCNISAYVILAYITKNYISVDILCENSDNLESVRIFFVSFKALEI